MRQPYVDDLERQPDVDDFRQFGQPVARLLGDRAVGALADAAGSSPPTSALPSVGSRSGVEHPPLAVDRRLAHVQRAAEVHGHVAGARWAGRAGQVEAAAHERGLESARCEPATTRSWPDVASAPVTESRRSASSSDRVAAEAAVLVPGHVGDALDDADRLHQRLDRVARPQVAGQRWPSPVSRAMPGQPLVGEERGGRGECSWKHCMRTRRSSPSAVVAHHDRPSSGS